MLSFRYLSEEALPGIEVLAAHVMASLPDKRWYYYLQGDPEVWFREGWVLGAFDGEQLVGMAAYTPEENRGANSYAAIVGDERRHTFDFHDVMVEESYRRRGIHREFCRRIREHALREGVHGIYLTVDPENVPSRTAFEKAGYLLRKTQPAYDGRIRCYYCQKL